GLEYSHSGVQAIRATLVLWALAGQLDTPGGRCFTMPGSSFPVNREGHIKNPDTGPRLGKGKFPVYVHYRDEAHAAALPKSVLEGDPYRIRSLIVQGASLITSWPEPELWEKTLGALDFLVCIDRQMTADAAYADILLPASTYFEVDSYMVYGPMFKRRDRMIEPLGESRGDFRIMAELAQRLGYGHLYPQDSQDGEELLRHALKGSGFTYEQLMASGGTLSLETGIMQYRKWEKGLLRSDGKPGFETPTGKFEIASSVLEEFGYDPLPVYTEPEEGPLSRPELSGEYPLIFTSGSRSRWSFHTQYVGNPAMLKARPGPQVTMNAGDAKERGIAHGDMVRISSPRGSQIMRARVTEDIVKGTVDANHACGGILGPEAWTGCNINWLTDINQSDPISGFPIYKSLLCEIAKVGPSQGSGLDNAGLDNSEGELEVKAAVREAPKREVYLDNNATTRLAPLVREFMHEVESSYGNASSIHAAGRISRKIIDHARRKIAQALGCTARRIVFTGSGSESNNYVLKGILSLSNNGNGGGNGSARADKKQHIVTSAIEHPSVLGVCKWLEEVVGVDVTYLPVDAAGMVNPRDLKDAMRPETALVSVMLANNETGTIQPIKELAAIAHEGGALMHTDAVQGFGKIAINLDDLGVDFLSVSAHKLNGPKGVGALYVGRGANLEPLIHGGGQEHGMRAGTENITGIAGFGRAVELIPEKLAGTDRMIALRDTLYQGIKGTVPEVRLNGHTDARLSNTLNITMPGFRGESVVLALARYGVYLSSGSACKSGSSAPSEALLAMGLGEDDAHCSLRFSLGTDTTPDDIRYVVESLRDVVARSRNFIHFVPCR
ncbi:MAG TPA: aminotransferase class V-fold PLP-dependent enzyme, partial [Nitrospirae bacterium]|nr:aminotransferase class V-fold PLP-dependent enzyme [Nitrospirota bacterium]